MQPSSKHALPLSTLVVALILLACTIGSVLRWRHRMTSQSPIPSLPAAFPSAMPQRVLWAWEEPEDLHTLPQTVGVAYLAATILVSDRITSLPRRQPLISVPGAPIMAVVRIETRPGFADTPALRSSVVQQLAELAARPNIRAFQIDFDATVSQYAFYSAVLQMLRPQLRPAMPFSITALVSWCGPHSWLHALPIDEAVPMFFRMGGPRALSIATPRSYRLAEPLCRTSLGVATDEQWPANIAALNPATRVYIFAPRPWQNAQLAAISTTPTASLAQELSQ